MRSIFLAILMLPTVLIGLPSYVSGAERGLELVVQKGHSGSISRAALSGDGQRALTGSDDTAILWDAKTGTMLRAFAGNGHLWSVALSDDGTRALTQSDDATIVWDVETGAPIRTFDKSIVWYAALTADGKRALTVKGETATLWDVETGTKIATVANLVGRFNDLSFDGKRMLTIKQTEERVGDKSMFDAILWDVKTGAKVRTVRLPQPEHGVPIQGMLSGDGGRMLTVVGRTAILWDAKTGAQIRSFAGNFSKPDDYFGHCALSRDGERVVTGSNDKTAVLWEVKTGKKTHISFVGPDVLTRFLALSGDGKWVLASAWREATLWDVEANTKIRTFSGHASVVDRLAVSGDGKRVLTAREDWDAEAGTMRHTFVGPTGWVWSVAVSRDGKRVLTISSDYKAAILWDAEAGTKLHTLAEQQVSFDYVALSGDGKRALTGSSGEKMTAILWDADAGTKLRTIAGDATAWGLYGGAAFSDDGKRMLTLGSGTVTLWNAETGAKIRTRAFSKGASQVNSVAFSRDGKRALTGSQDGSAVLWDIETLTQVQTFAGQHNDVLWSAALSGDGKRVLTGSFYKPILWDAGAGTKIASMIGHTGRVTSVALSSDGKRGFTASDDGTVGIWENGRLRCQLISLDEGREWLVITPDGFFDGSPNATKLVSYRQGGTLDFVPLERYQKHYFRPGLLAEIFRGDKVVAKVPASQALPPKVCITSPTNGDATEAKLEVRAEAASMGDHPVKEFRLLLDGRPVGGPGGVKTVQVPKLGEVRESWIVEITPGRHTLKVLADSAYSQGVSDEVEVRYVGGSSSSGAGAGRDVELPRLYVFAVGISEYKDEKLRLDFAGRDAKAVADAFRAHSKPLFRSVEVKLLTDKDASRAKILQGLSWLSQELTAKDYGVLYFSGHGDVDTDGSHYLLPADVDVNDLLTTGVPKELVKKRLLSLPGGRVMFIIDACHSGGSGPKKKSSRNLSDDLIRDLTTEESGLVVMCSSTGLESSVESNEHKMGAFTVALVEALSGKAKKNADGAVYLTQIDAYVADRVKELTKGRQHPTTSKPDTIRSFPLSKP